MGKIGLDPAFAGIGAYFKFAVIKFGGKMTKSPGKFYPFIIGDGEITTDPKIAPLLVPSIILIVPVSLALVLGPEHSSLIQKFHTAVETGLLVIHLNLGLFGIGIA